MRAFAAILFDAYRQLNAKKLFWISLIISFLIVAVFAIVDITAEGMKVLHWTILPAYNTELVTREDFFVRDLFIGLGVKFWLTWGAAILGLVSTAGIFPDMMNGGSIELVLSRPISRTKLFLFRYLSGLLFVTLQVAAFVVAAAALFAIKDVPISGRMFLAIPIVVLFFSYLFGICVFFGVLTRSTIASLLLTILVWFFVFVIASASNTMRMFELTGETDIKMQAGMIEAERESVQMMRDRLSEEERNATDEPAPGSARERLARAESNLDERVQKLESETKSNETLGTVHTVFSAIYFVIPKTGETTELLNRWMTEVPSEDELRSNMPGEASQADISGARQFIEELRDRPLWWVIGTSLAFEFGCVLIGLWMFNRRDF